MEHHKTDKNQDNKIEKPTIPNKMEKERQSWREHKNPVVRYFAKFSYTVWLVVMAVGVGLALIIALMLL